MNQGIPKSVRDALRARAPVDEHPSADVLNGYAEHRLTRAETDRVLTHLASCAECRDVLFLSGAAIEEPALAAAIAPTARRSAWWMWTVPAATAAALVGGVLIYRQHSPSLTRPSSVQIASSARMSSSEVEATPSAPPRAARDSVTMMAKSAPEAKQSPQPQSRANHRDLAGGQTAMLSRPPAPEAQPSSVAPARNAAQSFVVGSSSQVSAGTAPSQAAPPSSQTGDVTSLAPRLQTESDQASSAVLNTPMKESLKTGLAGMSKPAAAAPHMRAAAAAAEPVPRFRWRITTDGQLERSLSSGSWTRVLSEQPIAFRAVAVIGNSVWAGGSDGALFHSVDGGERWTRVTLGAGGETGNGIIVSIHFDSPLQGSVTSDGGVTWSTADGGQTWARH